MAFLVGRGKFDKEDYAAFDITCGKDVTFSNGRKTAYVPIRGILVPTQPFIR